MNSQFSHQPPQTFGPLFSQLQQGKTTVAAIAQHLRVDETVAAYWVAAETLHDQAAAHRFQTERQKEDKRGRLQNILNNPGAWLKNPDSWRRFVSTATAFPLVSFDLQLLVAAQTTTTPSALISSSAADRYDLPSLNSESDISLPRRLTNGTSVWRSHYSWDQISRGIAVHPPADGGVIEAQPHPFLDARTLAHIIRRNATNAGLNVVVTDTIHPQWQVWPQLSSNTIFTTSTQNTDRPEFLPQWIYAYSTFVSRAAQGRNHSFANPLTHSAAQHILASLAGSTAREFPFSSNLARIIQQTDTESLMAAAIRTSVIARTTHESVESFFARSNTHSNIPAYYEAARRTRGVEDPSWKAAHKNDLTQIHEKAIQKAVELPPIAWEKVHAALSSGLNHAAAPARAPETLSPAERISAQTANPPTFQSGNLTYGDDSSINEPTL